MDDTLKNIDIYSNKIYLNTFMYVFHSYERINKFESKYLI